MLVYWNCGSADLQIQKKDGCLLFYYPTELCQKGAANMETLHIIGSVCSILCLIYEYYISKNSYRF